MEAALIPARGLEIYALRSTFHLALAIPDALNNPYYVGAYRRAANRGDYIILDNGAAESQMAPDKQLIEASRLLRANEIVAPDVIKDGSATVLRTKGFCNQFAQDLTGLKVMAVAQGSKLAGFRTCVDNFARVSKIKVVGIPRHAIDTLNSKAARIDLANWINEAYPLRFDIHFLGTNPKWLHEIKAAATYAPHVRSVDSALPFNYTIAHTKLATTNKSLTRHPRFFTYDWSRDVPANLLRDNIKTFMEWAGAKVGTPASVGGL